MPGPVLLAAVSDLLFQSRLREQAGRLSYDLAVAETPDALRRALDEGPALLVLDLHDRSIAWQEAVSLAKERGVPVLAFGRHTEPDLLRAARVAGCDRVVPRSTFVERLPELIGETVRAQT